MENNQKVAFAHRMLAWLYAIELAVLVTVLAIARISVESYFAVVAVLVVSIAFLVMHYLAYRAALRRENWARIFSISIGIVFLPGFPILTIVGVLLLAYAWNPWVAPMPNNSLKPDGPDGPPA